MKTKLVKIDVDNGMHLRIAAQVVREAQKHKARVTLCKGCRCADTCSILDVLSLAAAKGECLKIVAEGPDEEEASIRVADVFSEGAGI